MVNFVGPDVAQVKYTPVIDIADSKKNPDAATMKVAGSLGTGEFTAEELITIYQYIGDFIKAKGFDPTIRHDQAFLTGSN